MEGGWYLKIVVHKNYKFEFLQTRKFPELTVYTLKIIIPMTVIKDITGTELDKVLELLDFGKLDVVESCIDEPQDMSEELLCIVLAQADDTLNM